MHNLASHWHPAVKAILAHAEPILTKYGYAGIFLTNLAEGFGVPLPGQTLLMAGALLALEGHYAIGWVLATAFAASFLGPCIGFWIGRRGGRSLLLKVRINETHLDRVEGFFHRYGVWLLVFCRFLEGFRQLTPILAGSMNMAWRPFLLASFAGSLLYVGVWGGGVYLLGRQFHAWLAQMHSLSPYTWALCGLLLLLLLIWLLVWRRGNPEG